MHKNSLQMTKCNVIQILLKEQMKTSELYNE